MPFIALLVLNTTVSYVFYYMMLTNFVHVCTFGHAVAVKKEVPVHQFHPLAITLHCLLLWTYCSCHVRRELGSTGVLLQLVKQIRVIEELPAWEKVRETRVI